LVCLLKIEREGWGRKRDFQIEKKLKCVHVGPTEREKRNLGEKDIISKKYCLTQSKREEENPRGIKGPPHEGAPKKCWVRLNRGAMAKRHKLMGVIIRHCNHKT